MTSRLHIAKAARIVLAGGVIAYPTEAVFGIGCLPLDRDAVSRILSIKRRSPSKGFIVVAADIEQLSPLVQWPNDPVKTHIQASWPGPNTWVVAAKPQVPSWLTGGRDTLAVRVSGHPVVQALCRRARVPLISSSANLSHRPPIKRSLLIRRAFGDSVDYIVPGEVGHLSRPTTIRDAETGNILRPG